MLLNLRFIGLISQRRGWKRNVQGANLFSKINNRIKNANVIILSLTDKNHRFIPKSEIEKFIDRW